MLDKILIFVIFLGPLVFFHELGHFLFARLFGVRVEVFSLGFGPKLFKFKKGDTQYALSLIPLGGYVKMYGDDPFNKGEVPEDQRQYAFTHKSKWARFWIVFGGPLANFIMAFFIYFFLLVSGEKVPQAKFGVIPENTVYYEKGIRTGDVLTQVNGQEIVSVDDLNLIDPDIETVSVKRSDGVKTLSLQTTAENFIGDFMKYAHQFRVPVVVDIKGDLWGISAEKGTFNSKVSLEELNSSALETLYFYPVEQDIKGEFVAKLDEERHQVITPEKKVGQHLADEGFYPLDLLVKSIVVDSPADKAQIKQGDVLVSINGQSLKSFEELRQLIQENKETPLAITYAREGELNQVSLEPELKKVGDQAFYSVGVYSSAELLKIMVESKPKGFLTSTVVAFDRTIEGMYKTVIGFKRLITSETSFDNIGGPLTIGKVAADSFYISLSYFFRLMAIISINLGIINLFPIPVLDGGHILFLGLEFLNRGPLSQKKMEIAQQFGVSLLFLLIFVALYNDISKLM